MYEEIRLSTFVIIVITKRVCDDRHQVPAVGVVEHAVLLGAPVSVDRVKFSAARSVVAGRFVNGHSETDWLLGLCTRCAACSGTCCEHSRAPV